MSYYKRQLDNYYKRCEKMTEQLAQRTWDAMLNRWIERQAITKERAENICDIYDSFIGDGIWFDDAMLMREARLNEFYG